MSTVRTRFAPSPTGSLHVGGVRTALYCWLFARKHKGQFLLRIEDTDRARSSVEAAAGIIADMKWLGLDWDEGPEVGGPVGPYLQSERIDTYDVYIQRLLDEGKAYEAWETREELGMMRKEAERAKRNFRFHKRTPYTQEELAQFRAEGRTPYVRLRSPDHTVVAHDVIMGDVAQTADEIEDLVIRKQDGFPTYHFAVVVDDHLMKISHVLRGQEHLMNTHKHLSILEALGWEPPAHGHMPTIFNPTGSKMSKRDKAKAARAAVREQATQLGATRGDWSWIADRVGADHDYFTQFMKKKHDDVSLATKIAAELNIDLPMIEVMDFRKAGFAPEPLLNYLSLLGWSAGDDRELYTMPELIEAFSLERVGKQPARFDLQKLEAMNASYLRALDPQTYRVLLAQWMDVVSTPLSRLSEADLDTLIELFQSRARTFRELETQSKFLRAAPTKYDEKAVKKFIRKGGGLAHLHDARTALRDLGRWEPGSLERALSRLCEATGTKLGKYAQPIRIAISGTSVTPSLFQTLGAMDRDDAIARIDRAIEAFEGSA